jgi:predicted GNAT family N-acyltransferase
MKCIRVTNEEQLQNALHVRMEVFVREQGVPADLEMDEFDDLTASCRHHLVLSESGEPVAAGRWREYEPGTAKLQRIAVLKSRRGTGTGRLVVESLEQDARDQGYQKALLDAQCTAEPFYWRLGYVTESTGTFLDAGIPHVRMSKKL